MSYYSLLSGDHNDVELASLIRSFCTVDFLFFVVLYYSYYFIVVGFVTSVAVFLFKIDYSDIKRDQLKREVRLTLESYTTNASCYWIILQTAPAWSTSTDVASIFASYLINNILFSAWFYISHKTWHCNRTLYKYVHEHHHQSVVVCPLTALSNAWPESVWTSVGFALGPFLLGSFGNNVFGWYLSIFTIVGEAIMGHSRIPFTLEHATHHAVVNKNYGFYSLWTGRLRWDKMFGTWTYSQDVPRVQRFYPKASANYSWNDRVHQINWGKVAAEEQEENDRSCTNVQYQGLSGSFPNPK